MVNESNLKYDLTIGMIVKNEENNLEKCLKSLLPLKEFVNCEIIVTDTGSTDRTVEIAKKYADKVLNFEWCNDFSKARNFGIEHSNGKWFMFVDADEVFIDDISEIANFVKSEISENYNCATLNIKEFLDEKSPPLDFNAVKLAKMYPQKTYFIHKIHEQFGIEKANIYPIQATIHHFGYMDTIIKEKQSRNLKFLEEEYAKNPNDLRNISHLIDCYNKSDDKIRLSKEAIKIAKKTNQTTDTLVPLFHLRLCEGYYCKDDIENLELAAENFFKILKRPILPQLEVLSYLFSAYDKKDDLAKKYISFQKYQNMFNKLKETPDTIYSLFGVYRNSSPRIYLSSLITLSKELIECGEITSAGKILSANTISDYKYLDDTFSFLPEYIDLATQVDKPHLVKRVYDFYVKSPANEQLSIIKDIEEALLLIKMEQNRNILLNALNGDTSINFIALNNLRLNNYNIAKCSDDVIESIMKDKVIYQSNLYSDLCYSLVKNEDDTFKLFDECNFEYIKILITKVSIEHTDFDKRIYKYLTSKNLLKDKPIHKAFNCFLAYTYILIENKRMKDMIFSELELSKVTNIFEFLVEHTNDYINSVFSNDIEKSYIVSVLPNYQAFCYSIYSEFQNKETKALLYVKAIKDNIKYCLDISECINAIMKSIPLDSKKDVPNVEFQKLARKFKQIINSLIRAGKKQQALQTLEQYKQANPTDPDIKDLLSKINAIR